MTGGGKGANLNVFMEAASAWEKRQAALRAKVQADQGWAFWRGGAPATGSTMQDAARAASAPGQARKAAEAAETVVEAKEAVRRDEARLAGRLASVAAAAAPEAGPGPASPPPSPLPPPPGFGFTTPSAATSSGVSMAHAPRQAGPTAVAAAAAAAAGEATLRSVAPQRRTVSASGSSPGLSQAIRRAVGTTRSETRVPPGGADSARRRATSRGGPARLLLRVGGKESEREARAGVR